MGSRAGGGLVLLPGGAVGQVQVWYCSLEGQ